MESLKGKSPNKKKLFLKKRVYSSLNHLASYNYNAFY